MDAGRRAGNRDGGRIIAAPDEPNTVAAPDEPLIVVAALPDSSQLPAPELPLVQVASTDRSDPVPADVRKVVARIEILEECLVVDICIDRYLWALYQRTLKEDTIRCMSGGKCR